MIRSIITAAGLLAATGAAFADTGNVTFSGTVAATCALTVDPTPGIIMPSATLSTMSSKNPSGRSGFVSVTTTGDVNLTVDAANLTNHPITDVTPTVWASTYRVSGAQTVAETSGTTRLTTTGTDNVTIDLVGTKAGTDSFKPGSYEATVTVRCAP